MGLVDTTIYRIETQYVTRDEASRVHDAIASSADRAGKSTGLLKTALLGIGVGAGLHTAKSMLIDYNRELETSRAQLAGITSLYTSASIDQTWERAGQSMERFQQMAAKSALTTKDLVDMASMIERPLLQSGVRMKDMENITFGAANAAKAFGIRSDMAALDIEQALMGTLSAKDRFARALLTQAGVGIDYKKFNKLEAKDRVETLQKAMTSPAITAMAEKQASTFEGVWSTLQDNMSIALGKVGLPLFKEISKEIARWNDWLTKNDDAVQRITKSVAGGLVDGFRFVKSAVGFVVDHADILITVAKTWAAVKLVQGVGGLLGSGGGGAAGMATGAMGALGKFADWSRKGKGWQDSVDPFTGEYKASNDVGGAGRQSIGGLKGLLGSLPMVGQAFAGGYAVGTAFNKLTGASDKLVGVFETIGDVADTLSGGRLGSYEMANKFDAVTRSMGIFDEAIQKAAKTLGAMGGGASSTRTAAGIAGTVQQWERQINVLEDINAGRLGKSTSGRFAKAWGSSDKGLANQAQKNALRAVGFDDEEIEKLYGQGADDAAVRSRMIATLRAKSTRVGAQGVVAGASTDIEIAIAMKQMTAQQRESIDVERGTQAVMEAINRALASGATGPGIEEVKKILLANTDPFKSQVKLQQNITNNIKVEVSAKDPDRWMSELDAKVQRKIRAPTQAKRAIVGGF